jgi:FkbM family methyltransferase
MAARLLPQPAQRSLYRLGPVTRAIRGMLNRAAPGGLHEVAVAGGGLAGARLVLDLKTEKDLWLGTYEADLQAAIGAVVRPGMVVYDLGANVGYVSLLLARAAGPHGKVLAFEPLPSNLERLRVNVALNTEGSRMEIIPLAVSDRRGRAQFWVHASGSMGRVEGVPGRETAHVRAIEVDTVDLDSFVFGARNRPPDVVKMDIEGGEILACSGMRRVLRNVRPVLLLEVHGPEAGIAVWSALTETGYQVCRMGPGYPTVHAARELGRKAYLIGLPHLRAHR